MITNVAASVRAKLKQQADRAKEDFNLTLTRYGIERLLYRLSISGHAFRRTVRRSVHSGNRDLILSIAWQRTCDESRAPTRA